MESFEPEKEYLEFGVDLDAVPPELVPAVRTIKETAERHLFRWKKFPLRLPPPLLELPATPPGADAHKSCTACLRGALVVPKPEDAEPVARDAKGRPPTFTRDQLHCIRELGEFEVESRAFPGQKHRWRLSSVVQSGRARSKARLLRRVSVALRLLVVTARNRLDAPFLSLAAAAAALGRALFLLSDCLAGLPSVSANLLSSRLREERVKHLVAELTVEPDLEQQLEQLCVFVRYHIKKQTSEKCHVNGDGLPAVPYVYRTPKGQVVDLRLYNTELLRRAVPFLARILDRELGGWFPAYREAAVAQLRAKKLPDDVVEEQAQLAVQEEYLRRVLSAVRSDPGLEGVAPGLGRLLAEQAHAAVLQRRAADVVRRHAVRRLAEEKSRLEEEFPVLSLSGPWMRSRLRALEEELARERALEAHGAALAMCRERGLAQAAYFVGRDLGFLREQAPALQAELARMRTPTRTFSWRFHIWRPSRWQVRRVGGGCTAGNSLLPSPAGGCPATMLDRPSYVLEKQAVRLTSTRYPFWRWGNYALRTFSHTCNAMFLLGVVIPWCSPLSLRSLVLPRPFASDYEVDQEDGSLRPRKSSSTPTLCSRLRSLWRHISKSRTDFESQPDTGFVGKGLSRNVDRAWNYLLKGVVGTLLLALLFPACCLVTCALSLSAALVAPLWMPLVTLVIHLFALLVYDFDSPGPDRNKICVLGEAVVWEGFVRGLLQPVGALLVAAVLCPVAAAVLLLAAFVRWGAVRCWDAVVFHAVLKRGARLPPGDGWLSRRVAGPGLSQDHLYEASSEQALAALVAKLELEVLSAHQQRTERHLLEPLRLYDRLVGTCFGPFGATLSREHGPYRALEAELNDMVSALKAEVDGRRRELQLGMGASVRSRTRMREGDLRVALSAGAAVARHLLPLHLFPHLETDADGSGFWRDRGLEEKDFLGLTAQLYSELFSPDVLVPLRDDDVAFKLETIGVDLSRYKEMARTHAAVDVSCVVHAPQGKVHVHAPFLDLSAFNPQAPPCGRSSSGGRSRAPWKPRRGETSRPELPPAVPHPAKIALIVFNRENDDPIPLDSDACRQVLQDIGCGGGPAAGGSSGGGGTPAAGSGSLGGGPSLEDATVEPRGRRATYATRSLPQSTSV